MNMATKLINAVQDHDGPACEAAVSILGRVTLAELTDREAKILGVLGQKEANPLAALRDIQLMAAPWAGRELSSHKVPGLNEVLTIEVLDARATPATVTRFMGRDWSMTLDTTTLSRAASPFSPRPDPGDWTPNGVSIEALLVIVEDRLLGFQSGGYACRENAVALTKIQEALMWLQRRTRDRIARGGIGGSRKAFGEECDG